MCTSENGCTANHPHAISSDIKFAAIDKGFICVKNTDSNDKRYPYTISATTGLNSMKREDSYISRLERLQDKLDMLENYFKEVKLLVSEEEENRIKLCLMELQPILGKVKNRGLLSAEEIIIISKLAHARTLNPELSFFLRK